jgi:hypothetical protein
MVCDPTVSQQSLSRFAGVFPRNLDGNRIDFGLISDDSCMFSQYIWRYHRVLLPAPVFGTIKTYSKGCPFIMRFWGAGSNGSNLNVILGRAADRYSGAVQRGGADGRALILSCATPVTV